MPAQEIVFRVGPKGLLSRFTAPRPHVTLALWCDWTREVIEIVGATPSDVAVLQSELREMGAPSEAYELGPSRHVLVLRCCDLPHDLVNLAVDDARALLLPPTRFENGHEIHRIVSFSEASARTIFRTVQADDRTVEILAKRPLRVQPLLNTLGAGVSALLEPLTDRQVEALLAAQRFGLYESPKRTTPTAVARSLGVSRTTFEEHLRKAEARLLANVVPYLELHAKARRAATDAGEAAATGAA